MILHVDADRDGASLVSIPRDSWVDVPGYGYNKINAAFSLAGPSLAIETVEKLTGVRIDHLAVVDWAGFQSLIDTVGGVTVTVPRTIEDPHFNVVWTKGQQTLNGAQALLYVRQRYGLPMGDVDRVKRQQAVVRGLMPRLAGDPAVGQPGRDLRPARHPHQERLRRLRLGVRRHARPDDGHARHEGRGHALPDRSRSRASAGRAHQSVVYLDQAENAALWDAVRDDKVARWASANPLDALTGPAQ